MKYLILALALSTSSLYAQQGIKGKVEWLSGNQMPGPGKKESKAQPLVRKIYIYEPTTIQQATLQGGVFFSNVTTKLITTIKSKKDGSFCVKLPPGEYSLFVSEQKGLFANSFDSLGRIQCISVKKDEYNSITILVNYEAAY
jgi:hypothetical protein